MPVPEIWFEKATLASQAARLALDAGNLPAAANRAYFSLHAFLTGSFVARGQAPPASRGNWPHAQLDEMIRQTLKTSFQKP